MLVSSKLPICAIAMSLVAALPLRAYERPLDSRSIREAYFLGQRNDEKTARFLAEYVKRLPVPKSGPHVAEIQLLTPYAQVVNRARQTTVGYSAQQAQKDYEAQPDLILVRVRINLTPTYPAYISRGKGQVQERSVDFWRDFEIRLTQGERITPKNVSGRALYDSGLAGPRPLMGALQGAEVLLEFDAAEIRSVPARIEVLTPEGKTVEAEFDLGELR